jgi:polyribonucleotide nucleotidyltransferase
MFKTVKKTIQFGNHAIELETGKIARQASGAVVATMGETVVLVTVVGQKKAKAGIDFFPLTVNYLEKSYAANKFPGGFYKRDTKPSDRETLIARLIDRPIRPLFPDGFFNEVQIICTVLSYDPKHQPDIVAIVGASAALAISGIPFETPVGAARVGYKDGEFMLNPSAEELKGGVLDLVVAGTKDAVLMVESEAQGLSEEVMLEAVMFGHRAFQSVIAGIHEMAKEVGNPKWEVEIQSNKELEDRIRKEFGAKITKAYKIIEKQSRYEELSKIYENIDQQLIKTEALEENKVKGAFESIKKEIVRGNMLKHKVRIDGRKEEDIRNIVCEVDILPKAHGSALFTRGETQALAVVTLGTGQDEQLVDNIEGESKDRFMLHYNFPPYSVGEVGAMRAPGRREIGHGKLAYRAINPVIPSKEEFPYTIRAVSEVTESNGSSSMATVCGTSLSLMAAGVPMKSPVAGIAMGLIMEGKEFVVLSDIMGDEDHLGDMDFKVAGTENGINALQMDIKISGITEEIMRIALAQAKKGRMHILGKMAEAIEAPRGALSPNAPQIHSFKVPKEKIGEIIGPGGKVIKDIIEKTGVKIDINDEGVVNIAATAMEAMQAAVNMVNDIIAVPEIGKIYDGKVVKITDFGIFVSIMRNTEGLVHVSELSHSRVRHPKDLYKEGDLVRVKMIGFDRGKIKLSIKATLDASEAGEPNTSFSENRESSVNDDMSEDVQPSFVSEDDEERGDNKHRKRKMFGRDKKGGNKPNFKHRNNNADSSYEVEQPSQPQKKKRFF